MDLKTIKQYDDSWWLAFLRERSIFDVDNIKAQKEWLLEQAEKVERYEKVLKEIADCNEDTPFARHIVLLARRTVAE